MPIIMLRSSTFRSFSSFVPLNIIHWLFFPITEYNIVLNPFVLSRIIIFMPSIVLFILIMKNFKYLFEIPYISVVVFWSSHVDYRVSMWLFNAWQLKRRYLGFIFNLLCTPIVYGTERTIRSNTSSKTWTLGYFL